MTFSHRAEDYHFELPPECIAQRPSEQRDRSRLMVVRGENPPEHRSFAELGTYLTSGDVLVLNQTKVMNARLRARKDNGTEIEVFLLSLQEDPTRVPVLFRPAKRVKPGTALDFPESGVRATVVAKGEMGRGWIGFPDREALTRAVEQDGELPLPPYIKREEGPDPEDAARYQTVFASELGAVAAPTAGLHFTPELLAGLSEAGISVQRITLHVGIGTFKPLTAEDIRDHSLDGETYGITPETAEALNRARAEKRRIIAVGTTSTRCLESNFRDGAFHGETALAECYIYPGYRFRAIDGLITNFHLPGSSLILLVAALVGRERVLALYREAIAEAYRFYSYGDAMLLLDQLERM